MSSATYLKFPEHAEMQAFMGTRHIGRPADGGIDALYQRIEDEGNGTIRAIRLPWQQTDKSVGYGFAPGQTTILAGSAGVAKSYLLLNILRHAGLRGIRWRLLPLEDDAGRWMQRMLAVHTCSWSMVMQPKDDTAEERRRVADSKLAALDAHREYVAELYERIAENPRLPVLGDDGEMVSKDVDYAGVLTFVREAGRDNELLAIDPLTQITFGHDGKAWVAQEEFMREIVASAASTGTHVIMVAHYSKGGSKAPDPLDGIAGSSLFGKITHNALSLARLDPAIESNIFSRFNPSVEHRLMLTVQKGRGGLSGDKIAFDLHEHGPQFIEHGLIRPKGKS